MLEALLFLGWLVIVGIGIYLLATTEPSDEGRG